MASKLIHPPDNREDLLYVKRVKKGKTIHCGYKRDYLARNLSAMEEGFVVCEICLGIMREASVWKGETTCLVCSESPTNLNPVKIVHNAVNRLEMKCPLLGDCFWKGSLSKAEHHLDNCKYFLVKCHDCKVSVARGKYNNHKANMCILRVVECDYCYSTGKAQDLKKHFRFCSEYPISCPNNCGEEFPRDELHYHKSECELERISCPYTEYGCKAKSMLRKDLLAHKKEFYIEHLDMSLTKIKQLENENNSLRKEKKEMEMEGKTMKQLDGVEWEIKNVDKLTDGQVIEGPEFYINNNKLRINIIWGYFLNNLQLFLERLSGDFDRYLGRGYITQYRVIVVNKQDINKSITQDGPMDCELCIGKESKMFASIFDFENCIWKDKSLLLRFYFEVNSKATMEKLRFCNEAKLEKLCLGPSDPFTMPLDD